MNFSKGVYNSNLNSCYNPNSSRLENSKDSLVSTNMRFNNLESRMDSLERMMKYFDDFMHLKEEEKFNTSQISKITPQNQNISRAIISELNTKIQKLENEISDLKVEKEMNENENKQIFTELNQKIEILESYCKNSEIIINNQKKQLKQFSSYQEIIDSLSDKEKELTNIMNEFSQMISKQDTIIEDEFQKKFDNLSLKNENKINEVLNLIQDLNKISENHDNILNKLKIDFSSFENDNIGIIKQISIQEEKIKVIDFIIEEIKKLKENFTEFINDYDNINNRVEEEKFTNEFLIKNN